MAANPSMFDDCSRVVVEGRDTTDPCCEALRCVSCLSIIAVVRWWLGLRTRVVMICLHVAGNGNLVYVCGKALDTRQWDIVV